MTGDVPNRTSNEHTKRVVAAARREIAGKRFTVGSPLHLLEMFIKIVEERSSDETCAPRGVGMLVSWPRAAERPIAVQGVLGTEKALSDERLKELIIWESNESTARALIELWERRPSPVKASGGEL